VMMLSMLLLRRILAMLLELGGVRRLAVIRNLCELQPKF
jgi:hypothetical protein